MNRFVPLTLAACIFSAACGDSAPMAAGSLPATGGVQAVMASDAPPTVDTSSIESALARFRSTLKTTPAALEGGAASREALVRNLLGALARSDTNAVRSMAVSRAEYAWLIYPESPLLRPPYRQPIDVAWTLHVDPHAKGFGRLLERLAGQPLRFRSLTCNPKPIVQGDNRFWTGCTVGLASGSDHADLRLFTALVERDRVVKVMSYDNDF